VWSEAGMLYYKSCPSDWYKTMNNEDVFGVLLQDWTQLLEDKNEYAYLKEKAKKSMLSYYEGELVGLKEEESPDKVPIVTFHGIDVNTVGMSNNLDYHEVRIVLDINHQCYLVVETNHQIHSSKNNEQKDEHEIDAGLLGGLFDAEEEDDEEEEDDDDEDDTDEREARWAARRALLTAMWTEAQLLN
jgi:hypothetical protein